MTGDLLQSDIDLARKLINAGTSDSEILSAFRYRKLSPEKASRLVVDLRQGLEVRPDPLPKIVWDLVPEEFHPQQREKPRREQRVVAAPVEPQPAVSGRGFPWFRVAFLFAIVITLAVIFVVNRHNHSLSPASSPTAAVTVPPQISIEIQPAGLMVGGTVMNRSNALSVLSNLLGPPTRTNTVEHLKKVIYTYDPHGIVLFSDQNNYESLVVYFEPVGGANGTKVPFTGKFQIQTILLNAKIESKTLASVHQLEIKDNPTNSILSGHCEGLNLSFAYLNTLDRLSLVQVELP